MLENFIKVITALGSLCLAISSVIKELNDYNKLRKPIQNTGELCSDPYYSNNNKMNEKNCTPDDANKK